MDQDQRANDPRKGEGAGKVVEGEGKGMAVKRVAWRGAARRAAHRSNT